MRISGPSTGVVLALRPKPRTELPRCTHLYHRPRRALCCSPILANRRKRKPFRSITKAEYDQIAEQNKHLYPDTTPEQRKLLNKRFTDAQLRSIEAAERAVSTSDLATQAQLRNDYFKPAYLDDFSQIQPPIDFKPRALRQGAFPDFVEQEERDARKGGVAPVPDVDTMNNEMYARRDAEPPNDSWQQDVYGRWYFSVHHAVVYSFRTEPLYIKKWEENTGKHDWRDRLGDSLPVGEHGLQDLDPIDHYNKDSPATANPRLHPVGTLDEQSRENMATLMYTNEEYWTRHAEISAKPMSERISLQQQRMEHAKHEVKWTHILYDHIEDSPHVAPELPIINDPKVTWGADVLAGIPNENPADEHVFDAVNVERAALAGEAARSGTKPDAEDQADEGADSSRDIGRGEENLEDEELIAYRRAAKQLGLTVKQMREFRTRVITSHGVVNQTRLGKIRSQYVLCIAGNGKGLLGVGEGKNVEGLDAIRLAKLNAIRNMVPILMYERRTIYGRVRAKVGATEVVLEARPPGFGLRVSQHIFEMARCVGLQDLSARVPRSRNPMNVAKAVWEALRSQRHPEEIAKGRGVKLVDVRKVYYSGLV